MKTYANPYVAGVGLGLVLLASYVFAGRGLGASGAFASTAAGLVHAISPERVASNSYFAGYIANASSPWRDWLVLELAGVCIGGWVSAKLAGRARFAVEHGSNGRINSRLAYAAGGGAAMGVGAMLARGCTSGQALTGGALLSVGSWIFMIAAFASAYALAPFTRRLWR